MRKLLFILIYAILVFNATNAQEKEKYYEKIERNTFRFFFDKNYYLTDKFCEFKSIERVSALNPVSQKFDGAFKDFNNAGRLILEGNYSDGIKQGLFKAYHANGKLKWEANYVNNIPEGEVKHYYNNGQLAIDLLYNTSGFLIQNFYRPDGVQKIKNGQGSYEFTIPFEGYTAYGVDFYMPKGKIKNGVQDGYWYIYGFNQREKKHLIEEEQYENGVFKNPFTYQFGFIPYDPFVRGELLTFKKCSFDDFSNFNITISNNFTYAAQDLKVSDITPTDYEYTAKIDKHGIPNTIELTKKTSNDTINDLLERMIKRTDFYYPSLLNGEIIADELTVSGKIEFDEEGELRFLPIIIHREKGQ